MTPISAVIITKNEERNLPRCLASLAGVVDEIVVLDSGSTDRTRELAEAAGARVELRPFDDFTTQKNHALALATHDRVLSLDADEWLSPELRASILAVKAAWSADGYTFNRLNHYAGRPIRTCAWYPDAKVRLWDRVKGRWGGGLVHETVHMQEGARVAHLAGDLLHTPYERASQLVAKLQVYSDAWALENVGRPVSPLGIALKTAVAFAKNWILKRGFLDGYEGLLVSASNAAGVFYKYVKLYELNRSLRVSLVIRTSRHLDALELVLESALGQSLPPCEIIVADEGSREDTRALVEAFAARSQIPIGYVRRTGEARPEANRDDALAAVTGAYVVMIEGDLVLHPEFLRDHRLAARRGQFVQGGCVPLSPSSSDEAIRHGRVSFGPLSAGVRERWSAVRWPLGASLFSSRKPGSRDARSADLACWKEDLNRVNGFDEDAELVAVLQKVGLRRLRVRFGALGFHLQRQERRGPAAALPSGGR